jgi:hypothetical protein
MAVNGKQQIGNEACQDLYHQAVLTSCNQIVDAQMAFPPGKKVFDVPSELIGLSYLLGSQIPAIGCYPVIDAINPVSDQPQGIKKYHFEFLIFSNSHLSFFYD